MRRILLLYIFLFVAGQLVVKAQVTPDNPYGDRTDEYGNTFDRFGNQVDPSTRPQNLDSTNTEIQSLPPKLYMWRISENLGNVTRIPADTMRVNFQNSNLTEGMTGHYNYLGNLGAPRLSRIFFERRYEEPTIFVEPYSFFFLRPNEFNFTNSNVPFSNLTYFKAGNKVNGEERFKAYFSVNVNKQLAFGFNIDYLYGRGYYKNTSTSFFNATPFISYMGERYEGTLMYNYNYLKANQNGGITNDKFITNPEDMADNGRQYESTNIPTVMEKATSRTNDSYVFLAQRYKLGFHRDLPKEENDTLPVKQEFVPVTSFIHTMKVEWSKYKFTSADNLKNYYKNTYIQPGTPYIDDSTSYISVKNTLGISLLEGFNKYAKAGLTAYISQKLSKYELMNKDSISKDRYTENEIFVGGELTKKQGNTLHYHAAGEIGLLGKAVGQFNVKGDLDLNVRLGKDTVSLKARAFISNTLPSFYMRHYHSKHFYWDDTNMDKEFRTRIEGELDIAHWRTNLKAGVENIKNFTYFNQEALPEQNTGSIQVLSATLSQNFKLGLFHLDNEITWQKSSNSVVLPLPDLSLYHNLYIDAKLAKKVLSVQMGADVRYFTKYNALAYMAATGQYHLQPTNDKVEIGNYPIVNVYANLHLKRTRIYVMMYHINDGMGKRNYFYAPHYPINPRLFKIGISWNFYD